MAKQPANAINPSRQADYPQWYQEVIKAADSIKELVEKAVSDINTQPYFEVTSAVDIAITIYKTSKNYDFGLRLELKKRELTVIAESSFYRGQRSLKSLIGPPDEAL